MKGEELPKVKVDPKKKIEEIGQNLETIRRRIEEAEKQKVEFVKGKMKDREGLLAKQEELESIRKQVEKNLQGLNLVVEKDKRFAEDPEFQTQLKEVEKLVSDIAGQQAEINSQIDIISTHPDVEAGIHSEADVMNKNFDKNKETEIQSAEFRVKAKAFANELADYTESYNNFFKKQNELQIIVQTEAEALIKILQDSFSMLKTGKGSEKRHQVLEAIRAMRNGLESRNNGSEVDNSFKKLSEIRESLGWLGNKSEKVTIDYIVAECAGGVERYNIARTNQDGWGKSMVNIEKTRRDLVEKYKALNNKNNFPSLDSSDGYSIMRSEISSIAETKPGGTYKYTEDAFREIYQESTRSI